MKITFFNTEHRLAVLYGLVCITCLYSCENSATDLKQLAGKPALPPDEITGGEIFYYQSGKLNSRIYGDTILRMEGGNITVFTAGVLWEAYDSLLRKQSRLTADSAVCLIAEQEARFFDHVVIVDLKKKDTIWCEDLTVKTMVDSIFTWKPVHVKTHTENIFGKGLISNISLTRTTILQASGTMQVNDP
jgi:LPS export ABC transporter protein LptC